MRKLFGKLLCKLGRHEIRGVVEGEFVGDEIILTTSRNCIRCFDAESVEVTRHPRIFPADPAIYRRGRLIPQRHLGDFLKGPEH